MKANLDTLKQALQLTAKAHRNAEFYDWSEDKIFAIHDDHVPIIADVKTICKAFYGRSTMVEVGFGFTNIWYMGEKFLPEVNVEVLDKALPCGWINQIED